MMDNIIFTGAHEHTIETVPDMIFVYNEQATLLNIINPSCNLPFNPEGMIGKKIETFLDWETGRIPESLSFLNLIWKKTGISIVMKSKSPRLTEIE